MSRANAKVIEKICSFAMMYPRAIDFLRKIAYNNIDDKLTERLSA